MLGFGRGEAVEISLQHAAAVSSPRPIFSTPRHDEAPEVHSAQDQVCGAAFAAHWGMSSSGALEGHRLALQASQRFKLGRATRSGLLKVGI